MTSTTRARLARVAAAAALAAVFWWLGGFRRDVIRAVIGNDAPPGPRVRLPEAAGQGLAPSPHVRVILVDGAGRDTASGMAAWNALCARGLDLSLDVGFPTVSLPVQVALWTGRTQQQTGILYHSGKPLAHPLAAPAIPPQVPGAIAIAESHPYIVQSLGFADARPPLGKLPADWSARWIDEAAAAIAGPARLVFVHVLRIDTAGHKSGKRSRAWRDAAATADVILGRLIAAGPADARWLVLADHDHIAVGGHGSEARAIRVVRACLAGPGIATGHGGPVSIVDLSRALADSLDIRLADDAPGRPLYAALAAPVGDGDVLPALPGARLLAALALVALGAAASAWGVLGARGRRRLYAVPWWWPVALVSLCVVEMVPSLSTPMIYKPQGLDMAQAMAPGLALLGVTITVLARGAWPRLLAAQLGLPIGATAAVLVATGGAPLLWGEAPCPVVPLWTGWLPPLLLNASLAAGVAGLGLLATAALLGSDPSAPAGTRRSDPAGP